MDIVLNEVIFGLEGGAEYVVGSKIDECAVLKG